MVRGLTTYISKRLDIYLDDYELPHNSFIIIDGDSVAVNIYIQLEKKNAFFGGDYDNYANAIKLFFKKLSDCKVTPYVLFDGATAPKKVETSAKRLKDRVQKTIQIYCSNEHENELFPLFLIEVFKCIIKELNIAMVMCDFDCDKEVANVAKQLDCPVLSYDSDYFIYDVKYIPFVLNENEQNLYVLRKIIRDKETNVEHTLRFLRCRIFNRQTFLTKTKLTLEKLPILTVYLGNDHLERVTNIPQFCKYLNLRRGNFTENIIHWLAGKSTSEAINKMLDFYGDESKKKKLKILIDETIEDYTCRKSQFLKYLQSPSTSGDDINYDSSDYLKHISKTFMEKYRMGFYHHHYLDILLFDKYYPKPLVENVRKPHSHMLSFPIISAVHKILTDNSAQSLIFYGRVGTDVSEQVVPKYDKEVPNIEQLQEMNSQSKLHYFFKVLNIEEEFKQDCLELFPNSWHMFLITLKYMSNASEVEPSFIYALVLSKIILSYVDKKLGYVRSWRDFDRSAAKYGVETDKTSLVTQFVQVSKTLEEIDVSDCLKAMEQLLPHFEISTDMKNDDTLLNRDLVHLMSQFQSCLLHIDFLNDIFSLPFEKCLIWELYNGTLIYNLFSKLREHKDFIFNLLEKSPKILRCFLFIVTLFKTHIV